MKNDYYTYAYLRKDGTPYYIGKGKGRRAFEKQGRKFSPPPRERIIFLKKNLTEEEAFKHEIYMIAVLGRKDLGTGILWNFTDGGEGSSGAKRSPEMREKNRRKHLGKKLSDDHIAKMRNSKSFLWRITFEGGNVIEVRNLFRWAKFNGYSVSSLSFMAHGRVSPHKDVIFVEKLGR